jgi:hypothetical protein
MQTKIERYLLRTFFLQYFAYLSLSKYDSPTDDSIYFINNVIIVKTLKIMYILTKNYISMHDKMKHNELNH